VNYKRPGGTSNGIFPAVGPASINGTLPAYFKHKDKK
jgi:hypothetical protein